MQSNLGGIRTFLRNVVFLFLPGAW